MNVPALVEQKTQNLFIWPIRVYYEDTDAGGVVYHSQYLNFMERARTEWLRSLGYTQESLKQQLGLLFVVRHIDIDYLHPARFDQLLQLESHISLFRRSSFIFSQSLWLDEPGTQRLCLAKAQVTIVCIDQQRFRPVAIPKDLQDALQHEH